MKYLASTVVLLVGLVNFYPVIGVISVSKLSSLYGIAVQTPELEILVRHRAVLFGLLGALIIASAFRRPLQLAACIAGLVSMVTFLFIAFSVGGYGEAIGKIVIVDVAASVALFAVLLWRLWLLRVAAE